MMEHLWAVSNFAPTFQGLALVLSVFVAIVVALIGLRQWAKAQKEKHTLDVLLNLYTNPIFTRANWLIMSYAERQSTVDPRNITHEEDMTFMSLLSLCEFISDGFLSRKLDRSIISGQRQSGLLETHEVLSDYISYKRQVWDRPRAYQSFDSVVKDYLSKGALRPASARQIAPSEQMTPSLETR